MTALRQAHAAGIEIVLVTGRRHTFALPIAKQLGFDLWLISSNGAVTRSLGGERFHHDLMPREICRELCASMQEFRGNTVLTFDKETKGAIVLEHMDELNASIRRWLEKNMAFIEFVVPIEKALVSDPLQAMFCGSMKRMSGALRALEASGIGNRSHRSSHRISRAGFVDDRRAECGLFQGTRPRAMGRASRLSARRGHGHR